MATTVSKETKTARRRTKIGIDLKTNSDMLDIIFNKNVVFEFFNINYPS